MNFEFFRDCDDAYGTMMPYLRLMSSETLMMALIPWVDGNKVLASDEDRRKIAMELRSRMEALR